jgi:para-aminobenzoate synthetase / 4-amino-4-deoxychorismate lyase
VSPGDQRPRTLLRVPLSWSLEPERAALLVRDDTRPFALAGRWAGGGAVISSEPVRSSSGAEDPFSLLEEQPPVLDPTAGAGGAVGGAWVGYLGYGLGRGLEPVGASPPRERLLPPFELAFYDHLLRLDATGRWWFEALWCEERAPALRERLATLEERARTAPGPLPFATAPWRSAPAAAGHARAVAAGRERIAAGDIFQANICTRLDSRLSGAPIDLFATAAGRLRPDRAAFLAGPWGAIASLSPELFLERHGRTVRSAPIKGTRPRPEDARSAAAERDSLLASAKDRAENVMIVDLVRNDLGRVCVPGTIAVQALADARAHTGVWHLVSEVAGELRDGVGDGELIRAAFPPGSVTGAPKVAALNVIAELESTAREAYTGAIGFASPIAGLELSVAIRTFEFDLERTWLGVGGGVVADSDPVAEATECATKARPLLDAIGARLAPDVGPPGRRRGVRTVAGVRARAVRAPRPRRLGPRPTSRPDPAAGVFETLLVADGRPVALEQHLARLAASVAALYGAHLPGGLAEELRARAAQAGHARLRVDLRPRRHGVEVTFACSALAPRRVPVQLCPVSVPGGLGAHKWSDRRLLDGLAASVDGEPLLCDLDGLVLESWRASVFAVEPGPALLTPPVDGRILPGVTRTRVLRIALALGYELRFEPLALDRLAAAPETFVTGALGGIEPARLGGIEPARLEIHSADGGRTVSQTLAAALRANERIALAGV